MRFLCSTMTEHLLKHWLVWCSRRAIAWTRQVLCPIISTSFSFLPAAQRARMSTQKSNAIPFYPLMTSSRSSHTSTAYLRLEFKIIGWNVITKIFIHSFIYLFEPSSDIIMAIYKKSMPWVTKDMLEGTKVLLREKKTWYKCTVRNEQLETMILEQFRPNRNFQWNINKKKTDRL